MAVLNSQLRLTLLDQVTGRARGIMSTLGRLRSMANQQGSMFAGLGGRLAMLTGGAASIYGVSRAFTSSLSVAGDFELAMNKLRVVSGATGAQFDAMRKQALELGRTTMFTASQTGDAQNFLAMAGLNANEILGAMPATLDIAAASGMELAQTADLVSNVMQQWGKSASDLGHVNDVLVTTFQNNNTNLEQLGEAMSYVAPVANALGVEFEEVSAAVGLLGNAGIQGSRAGTGLQQSMNKLLNPSKSGRELLNKYGISMTDAAGNTRALADVLEDFEKAGFADLSKSVLDANGNMLEHEEAVEALMGTGERGAIIMELFGQRAGPAFAALLGQGSRALRDMTRQVRTNEGATKRAADVMMSGWNGALRAFWSAYEGMQIAFGSRATAAFTPALQALTGYFGQITEFMDTLDRRVSIFQRLGTGARAFFQGLGFADASSALSSLRQFAVDGIFGSADPAQMVKDTEDMGRAWVKMRKIGEDVRAFIDDVSFGNLNKAVKSIWDAFSDLPGMGQVLVLFAAGKAFSVVAAGLLVLSNSPIVRLLAVAWALSTLFEAFKNMEGLTDFAGFMEAFQGLEVIDWVLIGGGIALIAGKVWGLARAFTALNLARGVPPVVPRSPPVVPPATAGAGLLGAAGKWGSRILRGGGLGALLFGGWKVSQGAGELAEIATGKYFTGKDDGALQEMLAQERELVDQIAAIRDRGGFFPELTENEIAPLAEQLDLLRNRIEATRKELEHESWLNSGPKAPAAMMPFLLENPDTAVFDPSGDLQAIQSAVREGNAGTQKVNVQNPVRPNVINNITVNATTNASPVEIGRAVGAEVQKAADGYMSDGGM